MATRRELMDRAEARLSARSESEGSLEATRCFLRAMLVGIEDDGPVPDDLVARIADLLKIDRDELFTGVHGAGSSRRVSVRPPSFGPRRLRILVLGRADPARLPMVEAVIRAGFGDEAEVRGAALSPAALDVRAVRVLRLAGYPTEALVPRALAVDDMTWGDLVVTTSGEREDWERLLPRNLEHVHEAIDDPTMLARSLGDDEDSSEVYRATLRAVERLAGQLRSDRSARMPAALRQSSSFRATRPSTAPPTMPALGRRPTGAPPVRPSQQRLVAAKPDIKPTGRDGS